MKTTVVIDDVLMNDAMRASQAKTKREAIELGLKELVRRKNLDAFKEELGTFDLDLSLKELEKRRSEP